MESRSQCVSLLTLIVKTEHTSLPMDSIFWSPIPFSFKGRRLLRESWPRRPGHRVADSTAHTKYNRIFVVRPRLGSTVLVLDWGSGVVDILDLLLPAPTRLTLGFAPRLLDFVVMMADTGTTSAFLILLVAGGRWNQVWFSIWWSWAVKWHRLDFHFYAHCLFAIFLLMCMNTMMLTTTSYKQRIQL